VDGSSGVVVDFVPFGSTAGAVAECVEMA
jgi:hypothetical protein